MSAAAVINQFVLPMLYYKNNSSSGSVQLTGLLRGVKGWTSGLESGRKRCLRAENSGLAKKGRTQRQGLEYPRLGPYHRDVRPYLWLLLSTCDAGVTHPSNHHRPACLFSANRDSSLGHGIPSHRIVRDNRPRAD